MTETKNPFLEPYNTPHHTPPFHLIKVEHYEPAIREGMKEQNEEISPFNRKISSVHGSPCSTIISSALYFRKCNFTLPKMLVKSFLHNPWNKGSCNSVSYIVISISSNLR
jgi:hypothetical protein